MDLHKEEKVCFNSAEQDRIREFQQRLEKILPETSKPEVDLPTPGDLLTISLIGPSTNLNPLPIVGEGGVRGQETVGRVSVA